MKSFKKSIIIAILLGMPIITVASTQTVSESVQRIQTKTESIVSDTVITAHVKELFLADKDISSLIIHVTTKDQVVYLTGKVNNRYEKKIATNLAKTVHGVNEVKCNLTILNS